MSLSNPPIAVTPPPDRVLVNLSRAELIALAGELRHLCLNYENSVARGALTRIVEQANALETADEQARRYLERIV